MKTADAGVGIDIIDLKGFVRVASGRRGSDFIRNNFTEKEIVYAGKDMRRLAATFAAKEAVYKAFETGWIGGKDVEISRKINGAPKVTLRGKIRKIAKKRKVERVLLSLSSADRHAAAIALLIL